MMILVEICAALFINHRSASMLILRALVAMLMIIGRKVLCGKSL